ncbi:hypothetical protein [Sedimentitalea sp.]|uniref:hypothetical protein n=1 Tax=Sedimentitalea sp. TaxID=2048915 RepID=UPI003299F1D8
MYDNGLMAFWSDIDPDHVMRYQQWHNCEHIPERVTSPGFCRGCRYRAMDNRPHFLMFYETDAPEALASDYYLNALNNPTPWTREALHYFRNPVRNIYRKRNTFGAAGPFAAPWITSLRYNSATDLTGWAARCAERESVSRVRLYEVDEEISRIITSERKIYGGGPGAQQYLLLVEHTLPEHTESVKDLCEGQPIEDVFRDHYWLEISHQKEEGTGQ